LIAYDTTGTVVTGSNPARWAPRRANEATGTCEVLGGSPVAYPNRNCRNFGRIRNEGDYQAPRQYSVSVGLVF
jgi:hypothetical protein